MRSLFIYNMSVEVLVSSPIETDFLIQLDDIVKTRGRENLEVRIVQAWWRSCHVAQSVRWDQTCDDKVKVRRRFKSKFLTAIFSKAKR